MSALLDQEKGVRFNAESHSLDKTFRLVTIGPSCALTKSRHPLQTLSGLDKEQSQRKYLRMGYSLPLLLHGQNSIPNTAFSNL